MQQITPEHTVPIPVVNLGDVDYLQHGGVLLFVTDDEYDAEVILPPEDEDDVWPQRPTARLWTVYRFEVERPQLLRDDRLQPIIVAAEWSPDDGKPEQYEEWYSRNARSAAESSGWTHDELALALTDADPVQRLSAFQVLGNYWGWHNFDSEPLKLDEHTVHARYGQLEHCQCIPCELQRQEEIAEAIDAEIEARWARGERA